MAQRRRVSNTPYIYDNTARDLQIRRQMEEPRRQMSHETRKNREAAATTICVRRIPARTKSGRQKA